MPHEKRLKYFLIFLIIFSIFHLLRDFSQTYNLESFFTQALQLDKHWCANYCNELTIPMEIFILMGSIFSLQTNKFGKLKILVFTIFFVWLGIFLYDYFIYN